MKNIKEVRKQIDIANKLKKSANWDYFDAEDKWALYGYLHGLLWVTDVLKAKYKDS